MSQEVDDLWFSTEKLVILRAGERRFRLPQFTLAARSPVFAAMFQFPQPDPSTLNNDQEMIDGVPVVPLFDSAKEVEPFLRAIFDSSYFMPPPARIPFDDILGVLHLSHKYDVGYLYKRAILHLEKIYPVAIDSAARVKVNCGAALQVIPLLHAVDVTWLLPYAYYTAATYNSEDYTAAGKAWTQLPLEIQHTCLRLQTIQLRWLSTINRFLAKSPECASLACANGRLSELRVRVTERDMHYSVDQDPLTEWQDYDWDELREQLCDRCMADARAEHHADLFKLWEALPSNCGLGTWDALLEARKVALE
ncbi:hypothetical protein C8R46DRAFT_1123854 [Mycena filopes]|nr:hypothetical protein C8R46DRAFT_1123854 [Mycena filopes]